MKDKKKSMEWLVIFIILIVMFAVAGTYAFLNIKDYYAGTFNVEIRSKGVDIFTFEKSHDVSINLTEYNFSQGWGHDVVGETDINPTLETTNAKSKICYKLDMVLPDEQVFQYTNGNNPELVLDILYSTDGNNYSPIIANMDITATTGTIPIPVINDSDNYKHVIETTKDKKKKQYYKARVTFKFHDNVDQSINNNKDFYSSLNANVIEC